MACGLKSPVDKTLLAFLTHKCLGINRLHAFVDIVDITQAIFRKVSRVRDFFGELRKKRGVMSTECQLPCFHAILVDKTLGVMSTVVCGQKKKRAAERVEGQEDVQKEKRGQRHHC